MLEYYSDEIFTSDMFNIIKRDNAIIVKLNVNNNLLISSWSNPGYQENMQYVVNQSLTNDDYPLMESMDYATFQQKRFKELGLNAEKTTGIITSACMDNYAISTKTYKDIEVSAIVTAGADKNGAKAGDPASFYEHNNKYFTEFGTINIIILINANLEPGTLVTATITATEAKTSVLQDLKLESQFSQFIATGTGTDGICVISNKSSENHLENAGKHSKLGELIAKATQEATKEALYLQTFMSTEYQKTVLSRLSRFNITFDSLFENASFTDKLDYASKFYEFNKNTDNIAWISSLINLIDEVQQELLEIDDIKATLFEIIKIKTDTEINVDEIESIEDILYIIISSINKIIL